MRCPTCGAAELVHGVRALTFVYKKRSLVVPNIEADFCPACDEAVFGPEADQAYAQATQAFIRDVNTALASPDFILGVRKKLALGQREASEIFGGGINAFSRYERGIAQPSVALMKLLRVLDKHPELLSEIRS